MNARRPHLVRARIQALRGASSVTAPLPAVAAAAALIVHPGHTGNLPAIPATDTSGTTLTQADQARAVLARPHQLDGAMTAPLYKVKAGDSISAVAQRKCGTQKDWTGIYAASRERHLTARNANVLTIGQELAVSCRYLPGMLHFAPAPPPPPPPPVTVQTSSTMTSSASSVRHSYASPVRHSYASPATVRPFGSSYQQCVITRESGGQSQVMNASGHYGLYQFDYGTWVSGGGAGADFGHASVAEQNRVFAAVYAARGTQPWSPSDGC